MILYLTLSVTFLVMAAVFKSVADTLQHHYDTSVFKWKDPRWWKPDVSCNYVGFLRLWIFKTKFRPDAWHLANSGMITAFILSAIFFPPVLRGTWWQIVLQVLMAMVIMGSVFNLTFNLFYNKLLIKR